MRMIKSGIRQDNTDNVNKWRKENYIEIYY